MKKYLILVSIICSNILSYSKNNKFINTELIDKNIRPQDDFYNFVNGTWMKSVKIPPDHSS